MTDIQATQAVKIRLQQNNPLKETVCKRAEEDKPLTIPEKDSILLSAYFLIGEILQKTRTLQLGEEYAKLPQSVFRKMGKSFVAARTEIKKKYADNPVAKKARKLIDEILEKTRTLQLGEKYAKLPQSVFRKMSKSFVAARTEILNSKKHTSKHLSSRALQIISSIKGTQKSLDETIKTVLELNALSKADYLDICKPAKPVSLAAPTVIERRPLKDKVSRDEPEKPWPSSSTEDPCIKKEGLIRAGCCKLFEKKNPEKPLPPSCEEELEESKHDSR